MKCGLTYQETLDIVERFMADSGIREYCTKICKGECCGKCYKDNPNACHRNEGRRLPCSIFICYELRDQFEEKFGETLRQIAYTVREQYYKHESSFDVYFDVPDKDCLKTIRFPISIKRDLEEINIKKIKRIINELIKTKTKVYC